jgi:hypothetical protein
MKSAVLAFPGINRAFECLGGASLISSGLTEKNTAGNYAEFAMPVMLLLSLPPAVIP